MLPLWHNQWRFVDLTSRPSPCPAGRTNVRAGWAAQLAQDSGLSRVLVLRQGVYGWRLDPAVKPYRGYRLQARHTPYCRCWAAV